MPFDLVALYIPANPFHSLANNIVPAVVLFSAVVGVALIGVERKQVLLDVLQVARDAVSRATRFVSRLTPYGLFAIAGTAAGTLDVEQIGRVQVYLLTYMAVALLVSLWVLPGLVAALTPIPFADLLKTTRNALITAFVAGDLFIVLPALVDASKALLERHGVPGPDASAMPDMIVPISFNFPHSGKLLSVSFVLFAGWFADAMVPLSQYPQLALAGVVTFFGSLTSAVPFLLDLFHIPADTFQLFLATGVINSRFGTLLAAVHTVSVALLGGCAMTGVLRWQRRRVLRYGLGTLVATGLVLGGARSLSATLLTPEYRKDRVLAEMQLVQQPTPAVVHRTPPPDSEPTERGTTLEAIRRRGVLRVGYLSDALPYAYFNGRGDLVGFDIELAHRLASELGVRLELLPAPRDTLAAFLAEGRCDVVMSGVVLTTERASQMLFSTPYLDETLALVVRDHDRQRVQTWSAVNSLKDFTIGAPDLPNVLNTLRELAPRATVQHLSSVEAAFAGAARTFDALAFPAERGSAWTLLHPEFSVVVPEGAVIKLPLAYPIGRADEAFATFLNTWIELKRKDGTFDTLFKHWILGQNAVPRQPRWSIVRDVLHWLD